MLADTTYQTNSIETKPPNLYIIICAYTKSACHSQYLTKKKYLDKTHERRKRKPKNLSLCTQKKVVSDTGLEILDSSKETTILKAAYSRTRLSPAQDN